MENKSREHVNLRTASATITAAKVGNSITSCPHCGAHLTAGMEICPQCGTKLVDYCTFCGAPMLPNDMDCPECSCPADGLTCPHCGHISFRPFCTHCGKPITLAAKRTVERAKNDPKVQQAVKIFTKMAELEAELNGSGQQGATTPTDGAPQQLSEGEQRLQELMAMVGFTPAEHIQVQPKQKARSREDIIREYKEAAAEAAKVLEDMLPPAGMTPQEQRNYATARKVAVTEIVKTVTNIMKWVCHECHVEHDHPSECSFEKLGGTWTVVGTQEGYKTTTVYKRI